MDLYFNNLDKFLNLYETHLEKIVYSIDFNKKNIKDNCHKLKIDLVLLSHSTNAIREIENFVLDKNNEHIDRFRSIIETRILSLTQLSIVILKKLKDKTAYNYFYRGYMNFKTIVLTLNSFIPTPPEPKTPFTDPKTHELFNYIVDGWSYDKGQKWADIWNVINDLENYTPPYKNEYQNYIITRFGYTGKFQYDKPKKDGNRDKQNLLELIENFSKK